MTIRTFIEKYGNFVVNGSKAESLNDKENIHREFVKDLNCLDKTEVTFEQVEILIKALSWVGITFLKQRELFLILCVYRKTLDKQEDFSLKNAEEIFNKTEKLYIQPNRAVYGGQYFYLNEFFQITKSYDYRSKEDDMRYNVGNYDVESDGLNSILIKIKKL